MAQEPKIFNLLRLIRLLLTPPAKDLYRLAEILEVTDRSVRRYFDDLRYVGFPVDQEQNRFLISNFKQLPIDISYGFSIEESAYLQNVLTSTQDSPLRSSIIQKIFQGSELQLISDTFVKQIDTQLVERLGSAIREKRQVILRNYQSIESQTVKDRTVEPLRFVSQYTQIRCYEPRSQKVKSYSVGRIEKVELLDTPQSYDGDISPTDAFGLTSEEEIFVELALTEKAYLIMQDEFPLTKPHLKIENKGRFYRGYVRSYRGIGRFILSLPGEIEIIEPQGLKDFLNGEIQKYKK
jgi:proteasome accessory factor C